MATDMDKLKKLSALTYSQQAVWFLNAYFDNYQDKDREDVWNYAHKMEELDEKAGKEGNELDELYAHRFLEVYDRTMTVREMRQILREIDIDTNNKVSLSEFLISHYKVDWHELVNAPQSDNMEEIAEATRLVNAAAAAIKASQEAKKAAQAALRELQAQEKAFNDKKADLEKRSEAGGMVARNKAKNELQQLLAEDPLPLTRAKINQGAAVKRNEKALKAAHESMRKAEEYLAEVKSKPGSGQGHVWWMERQMTEQRKFMPQSRGGIVARK